MKTLAQQVSRSANRWQSLSPYAQAGAMAAVLLLGACTKPDTSPANPVAGGSGGANAATPIANGVYTLTSKVSAGGTARVLDVAAADDANGRRLPVINAQQAGKATQQWTLTQQSDGYYTLTTQFGGGTRILDAVGSGTAKGTPIQLYWGNNSAAQRFKIEADGTSGYYLLTPKYSDQDASVAKKLRLDVRGGTNADGTQVWLWEDNGLAPQRWKIDAVSGGGGTTPTPGGGGGPVSGPPGGASGWTQTFGDDFNSFDATKWTKAWPSGNGNPASATFTGTRINTYYQADGANVSVANGKLYIKTERKAQDGQQFTSGVVTTAGTPNPFMQKYGYFEVRMKPATTKGNDPDFWLFPLSAPPAGDGSQYKELDFAEFGGKGGVVGLTSHMPFVHPDPTYSKLGNYTSDFHTYGVLWESGKATLYIDGVLQGNISGNIVDEAGVLILSDEVRTGQNNNWFDDSNGFQGPVTTEVDWVRVWRKN